MNNNNRYHLLSVVLLLIIGGATPCGVGAAPADERTESITSDPLEAINRFNYGIHRIGDRLLLRPVAKIYTTLAPQPLEDGVTNFFRNLSTPGIIVNDLLQGKFRQAVDDTGRLVINSTLGLGGLIDVASRAGLKRPNEDLGQTFAVWGVPSGPYLFIPFLGPTGVRDGIGFVGELFLNPLFYLEDKELRLALTGVTLLDARAQALSIDKNIDAAVDPYVFIRNAYTQRREHLIKDGSTDEADLDRYYYLDDVDSLEAIE